MDYDIYTEMKAPPIPVSLFGDAAEQGARVGTVVPSTTSALLRGVTEGVDTYQRVAQNQASIEGTQLRNEAQAQINETRPKLTELDLQAKQQDIRINDATLDIKQLELEEARATQASAIELTKQEQALKTKQAQQQLQDIQRSSRITEDLDSNDPAKQKGALFNPGNQGYWAKNPAQMESTAGSLYNSGVINKEEFDKVVTAANGIKARQLENELKEAEAKVQGQLLKDVGTNYQDVRSGSLRKYIEEGGMEEAYNDIELHRVGTKTLNADGTIKTGEPDKPYGPEAAAMAKLAGGEWAVFYKGKYTGEHISDVEHKQYNDFHDSYGSVRGAINKLKKGKEEDTPAQAEPTQASTPVPEVNLTKKEKPPAAYAKEDIANRVSPVTEDLGLPEELTNKAIERGMKDGLDMGVTAKLGKFLGVNPFSSASGAGTREGAAEANALNKELTAYATSKATKDLHTLSHGSPEEREAVKAFFESKGLDAYPSKKELTAYYKSEARRGLSEVYETSRDSAAAEAKRRDEQKLRKDAAERQKREALKDVRSADEYIRLSKGGSLKSDMPKEAPADLVTGAQPQEQPEAEPTGGSASGGAPGGQPGYYNDGPSAAGAYARQGYSAGRRIYPYMKKSPEELTEAAQEVASSLGMAVSQANNMAKVAVRVQSHPLLADQPTHIKAIAAIESAGKTGAISTTGVRGLLQVTKATAASYGLNRDIPEEGVEAGKLYINDLLEQFGDNKDLAYAAYNAGPGAVRYAQRLAKDPNDWKEVKKHMYDAFVALRKHYGKGFNPAKKAQEVHMYPERASYYERIFG